MSGFCHKLGILIAFRRFLCTRNTNEGGNLLATSSLYVRGKYALVKRGIVLPYFDVEQIVAHLPEIKNSIALRGVSLDVNPLKQGLSSWKVIRKELARLEDLETQKKAEIKQAAEHGSQEKASLLKAELQKIYEHLREVKYDLSKLDEKVIPILLKLPNMIFNNDSIEAQCKVYKEPADMTFAAKSHVNLAGKKLQFMDNTLCYLLDDLMHLETRITRTFSDHLLLSGRLPVSAPDFALDTIVEACDTSNNVIVNQKTKHGSHALHLTGGASIEAFGCFLTRRRVSKLPLDCFSVGRYYRNQNDKPGTLRNLSQTSRVSVFSVSETLNTESVRSLLTLLSDIYYKFGVPFRFRMASPPELSLVECMRVDIEVWSPPENSYLTVGYVALHGDFLACRLNMCSTVKPLQTMFGCAVDIQALIAALLENYQLKDGSYRLPDWLVE